jgi:hypothetical protein
MRKFLLFAALCAVGIVAAPIASASAEQLTGACAVQGLAHFSPKLTETSESHTYSFEGSAACVSASTEVQGSVSVTGGAGVFTCLGEGASTTDGTGVLKTGAKTFNFKLAFTSNHGVVFLKVKNNAGAVTAEGTAHFAISRKQLAAECLLGGVSELEFAAEAAGTIGE